jgi:predicted component of type VI protein secretion system
MVSGGFFRKFRITLLLLVLFFVSMNSWLTRLRTTDWDEPLWVAVYPVNGDDSSATAHYIDTLTADTFQAVEDFLAREAARYDSRIAKPVSIKLAPPVTDRPPLPPANASTLSIMLWSLKLRYWAATHDTFDGPDPDVQMFVVYYDPKTHQRLKHSLGLQKGLIGVVNAFASPAQAKRNNVVIVHEFLHTVGASDKYDPQNNQPIYPIGFAEPDRDPVYPQKYAEIMAGRIPVASHHAVMPPSLSSCVVGPATALEIRWTDQ